MARGDIVYVDLPLVSGSRVQGGRRPAIVVIRDQALQGNPMTMIVPLTTNLGAARFPHTLLIEASSQNGLSVLSLALVFQLRAADRTYLDSTIGHLESGNLAQIDEMMHQMLGI